METRFAFALALFTATLTGCSFQLGSSTSGEKGRVQFSYGTGTGCFFGCDISSPLMTGTTESIGLDGHALPDGLTAAPDNPAVLAVTLHHSRSCVTATSNGGSGGTLPDGASCSGTIEQVYSADVVGIAPGDASLVVRAADGSVFDAIALLPVATPVVLLFSCTVGTGNADAPVTVLNLPSGKTCTFHVDALGPQGALLKASSGFSISVADPQVTSLHSLGFVDLGLGTPQMDSPVIDSDGTLTAVRPGTTKLVIKAGTLTREIPISVQ